MSSEFYRQALHDIYTSNDVSADEADDIIPRCFQSESRKEMALKFYSRDSSSKKEFDSDLSLSNSDEEMDHDATVHEMQGHDDALPSRRHDGHGIHHIRWADECHKELCRKRPRKRYCRHPGKSTPLKSILKVMQYR